MRCLPCRLDESGDEMSAHLGSPNLSDLVPASAVSRPRLHLGPVGAFHDFLDGVWWPRSTDPSTELPGLVLAIDGVHGEVVLVRLGADGWRQGPSQLCVGLRQIEVAYKATQPASLLTALYEYGGRINLLVVPSLSSGGDAAIAALGAAITGNRMTTSRRGATSGQDPVVNGVRAVDRWRGGEHLRG